jgi:hypothetical protein
MVMLSAGVLRAVGAPLGGYLGVLLLLGTFLLASGLWGLRRGRVPPPGRTD